MASRASKKRKQYDPTEETVRSLTNNASSTFEKLNRRGNCMWKNPALGIPALCGDGPDPNRMHNVHTKQVFLQMPQARPGDAVVLTLNDGFVADDGGFVWPNSVYILTIPDDYVVPANGAACMACQLPIISWHKRKDPSKPGSDELAWVYTGYASSARVVNVTICAAVEAIKGVLEICIVQPTIDVREEDNGNIFWPKEVRAKRQLVCVGSSYALDIINRSAFRVWMQKRAQVLNGAFTKTKSHVDVGVRLTKAPLERHFHTRFFCDPQGPSQWTYGTIQTNVLWKGLSTGALVVWRPPANHSKAKTFFAIGAETTGSYLTQSVWSHHIVCIWFHKGPKGLCNHPEATTVMMRVDYHDRDHKPKNLCVGFKDFAAAEAFLHALEPVPAHIAVHTEGASLPEAIAQRRPAARQAAAPAASGELEDKLEIERGMQQALQEERRQQQREQSSAAAPAPAPKPKPPKPERPKMGGLWSKLAMPVGKFLMAAFHPFTELELFQLRNQNTMGLILPKYRHTCLHLPRINKFNFEAEVIDKILALDVYPAIECNEPKRVWKQNVVDALNCHWYAPSAHEVKRPDPYSIDDPWSKLVTKAEEAHLDICVGLDGGSLHPVLDRMQLHNLLAARKEQQDTIEERRKAIRKWDEAHAEVFESEAAVSYAEAFRRKDAKLRRENTVVID